MPREIIPPQTFIAIPRDVHREYWTQSWSTLEQIASEQRDGVRRITAIPSDVLDLQRALGWHEPGADKLHYAVMRHDRGDSAHLHFQSW